MPASSCSLSQTSAASRLACSSSAPSCRQAAQSFSGSASQDGFGRLPAMVVSSMAPPRSARFPDPRFDAAPRDHGTSHAGGQRSRLRARGLPPSPRSPIPILGLPDPNGPGPAAAVMGGRCRL